MCGICGIVGLNDHESVARMAARMAHRGPDDSGVWSAPRVSLGHTRLSIIDVSPLGHQPMSNEDGTVWITFNGEIYNFEELRRELLRKGHRFHSATDTEVIVHLYEDMGEACLSRLRGMFSFAIWDAKKERLFAARDHLGIKPFFYVFHRDRLVFASELRAILASGLVQRAIDPGVAFDYFLFGSVQGPHTLVEGVSQLAAGHYLTFEHGKLDVRQYWALPFGTAVAPRMSPSEHAYRLGQALEESVKGQLISDVPLGVFLSGGIDSSLISLLAQWNSPDPVRTFSVVFEEKDYDEDRYSTLVARTIGSKHTRFHLTHEGILRDIPMILDGMDQPSADGFNTFVVSKAVRGAGIKVALSGLGADEFFAGYRHFRALPFLYRMSRATKLCPLSLRNGIVHAAACVMKGRGAQKVVRSLFECRDLRDMYLLKRMVFCPDDVRRLLPLYRQGRVLEMSDGISSEQEDGDPVNALALYESRYYLHNTLLADTDRMSMANSLEVRPPYLDHIFVEMAMTIPGRMKTGTSYPKQLLLDSFKGVLPSATYRRRKQGFVLPFDRWLREGALNGLCDDAFRGTARKIPCLDHQEVGRVWQDFLKGSPEYNYSTILTMFAFIHWYEKNMTA